MAGDWIKMRCDLAEDPAVIDIAARTGLDEFAVVGRLQALWSWADGQSRDGHAAGVTASWVNRKVQRDGFAEAMAEVHWLEITEKGITFPNFGNHNGETAKTRALGKNRKQKQRSGDDGHGDVTPKSLDASRTQRDKSVTREEKRREEIKNTEPPIGGLSASPPDAPPPGSASRETGQPAAGQQGLDGIDPPGEQPPKAKPAVPPCPYDALIDAYEDTLPMMPKVRRGLFRDGKRADAMRARWVWVMTATQEVGENAGQRMATTADEGIAWFGKFFNRVASSDFLTGRNGRWTGCDLEFLMTHSKFTGVLEGKYHQQEVAYA